MISYQVIREGIADAIMQGFKAWPIDDETAFHVKGPSFLVNLVENSHVLDDKRHVRRLMEFDVVYLAPHGTAVADIVATGLEVAMLLQPCIAFGGRSIVVDEVETERVGEDFHVLFRLDFFDELRAEEYREPMKEMSFKLELV